ncbi:unnamed protein product [Lactuca virosa]|uniref:Uncharacterized protein n=1 Tax=Lactuca virosa TaxID=75947 RepID=A0AAU9NU47_9ASTR|nr:unnamed protein product [Lactuca virosa]
MHHERSLCFLHCNSSKSTNGRFGKHRLKSSVQTLVTEGVDCKRASSLLPSCCTDMPKYTTDRSGIQGHDLLQEKQTQLVSFEKHTQFVHLSYCVNR